jgi:hypothetical protein
MKHLIYIFSTVLVLVVISIFLFQSFSAKSNDRNTQADILTMPEAIPSDLPEKVAPAPLSSPKGISRVIMTDIPQYVSFAGEPAPLDIFYVREYFDRELIVNTHFHSSTILLTKRANRWFPVIEPVLKENNVPDDFKYLALIESGLENVTSPAGAKGFWQFMKHTAREYNLEVNSDIDERYNVEKATVAACQYLNDAYQEFGNWTLVAAAYNAGKRRISQELEEQKTDNYYDLLLNTETARYIFRILAIKTIFENQEKYGFYFEPESLYPPIPVETITVNETIKNLVSFAHDHNITYKTLKYFNPWLLDDHLPNRSRRTYHLKIPTDGDINYTSIKAKNKRSNTKISKPAVSSKNASK